MTAFDYTKPAETAQRLLEKFGRAAVLKRDIDGGAWEGTHKPPPRVTTTYSVTVAIVPVGRSSLFFDTMLQPGSMIDERTRKVLMSPTMTRTSDDGPASIEPRSGDVVTFDGHDWPVLGATPLNPAGTPVLYTMLVKR